jgi:hypothetical protein
LPQPVSENKPRTLKESISLAQSLPSNLNNQDSTIKEDVETVPQAPLTTVNLNTITNADRRQIRSALPTVPKQHQKKVQIESEADQHGLSVGCCASSGL